jgi:hypothetical protein
MIHLACITIFNYISMYFGKKKMNGHDDSCEEKWGMMCSGDKHMFLRWIVGVIILFLVFSMGYKLGQINESIASGLGMYRLDPGYGMMRSHQPMMWGYRNGGWPQGISPAQGRMMQDGSTTPDQGGSQGGGLYQQQAPGAPQTEPGQPAPVQKQ